MVWKNQGRWELEERRRLPNILGWNYGKWIIKNIVCLSAIRDLLPTLVPSQKGSLLQITWRAIPSSTFFFKLHYGTNPSLGITGSMLSVKWYCQLQALQYYCCHHHCCLGGVYSTKKTPNQGKDIRIKAASTLATSSAIVNVCSLFMENPDNVIIAKPLHSNGFCFNLPSFLKTDYWFFFKKFQMHLWCQPLAK